MNKKIMFGIVGVIVLAGVFYGGMTYGGNNVRAAMLSRSQTFGAGARTRGAGGGFVGGQIIAKDATSITVQLMANGTNGTSTGSKIILLSSSTKVSKQADGNLNDLTIGTQVSVTGTTNSDGSVTAQSVQIRPNTPQNARVQ